MNKIQKYARFLQFLLLGLGFPSIIGSFLMKWVWGGTAAFNAIKINAARGAGINPALLNYEPSMLLQLCATAIDGFSFLLFFLGCFYFAKLLKFYYKGELFSENILGFYKKILWIAFSWTLYNPIKYTLLTLITTINNPKGQRILSFAFRGEDIFNIFIVGSFLVMNALMHEAYKLKIEQDLTV